MEQFAPMSFFPWVDMCEGPWPSGLLVGPEFFPEMTTLFEAPCGDVINFWFPGSHNFETWEWYLQREEFIYPILFRWASASMWDLIEESLHWKRGMLEVYI